VLLQLEKKDKCEKVNNYLSGITIHCKTPQRRKTYFKTGVLQSRDTLYDVVVTWVGGGKDH